VRNAGALAGADGLAYAWVTAAATVRGGWRASFHVELNMKDWYQKWHGIDTYPEAAGARDDASVQHHLILNRSRVKPLTLVTADHGQESDTEESKFFGI